MSINRAALSGASSTTARLARTARYAWASGRRGWQPRDHDHRLTAISTIAA